VPGDSTALHRAFSNLLRNAVEAARPETPAQVRVTASVDGPRLKLRLEDNGSGIPPDVLPHIFIPFYTTKTRGTGLGLALVHRIVQEHGGTILAESSSTGTAFTITLPREKAGKSAVKPG
jgi:signal transduction histidine kinase